jgi:CRISPR/Cas system CMR subunit Cmr4 (Cas7 group RAMP superfamily)
MKYYNKKQKQEQNRTKNMKPKKEKKPKKKKRKKKKEKILKSEKKKLKQKRKPNSAWRFFPSLIFLFPSPSPLKNKKIHFFSHLFFFVIFFSPPFFPFSTRKIKTQFFPSYLTFLQVVFFLVFKFG